MDTQGFIRRAAIHYSIFHDNERNNNDQAAFVGRRRSLERKWLRRFFFVVQHTMIYCNMGALK